MGRGREREQGGAAGRPLQILPCHLIPFCVSSSVNKSNSWSPAGTQSDCGDSVELPARVGWQAGNIIGYIFSGRLETACSMVGELWLGSPPGGPFRPSGARYIAGQEVVLHNRKLYYPPQ